MANYLDYLSEYTNSAIQKIAEQRIALRSARANGADGQGNIDNITWWNQLVTGANDTNQSEDLRLVLLTLLVDNAQLNPLVPVDIINLYQPFLFAGTGSVLWGGIGGNINDQTDLIAKFANYLLRSGGTMTGPLLIDPATRIDASTAGALNLGTTTATTINLGGVGKTINTGTIAVGVWNGTRVGVTYGGLGALDISTGTVGQSIRIASGGTAYEFYTPIDGANYLPLTGGTLTGNLLLTVGSSRIDAATAGVLNIGTSTATIVNLGKVGGTINTGTINTGVWNGTVISRPYGGFGNAMPNTPGDNYLYGYDVTDDESKVIAIGANLVYTQYQIALASTITGVTIGSGSTWNGNAIPIAKGGSGQTAVGTALQYLRTNSGATGTEWATLTALTNPMDGVGQLIYGGVAGVATKLAADTSNTKKFLTTQSIAGVGQAPAWGTISLSDVPVISLAKGGTGVPLIDPNANRLLGWDNGTKLSSWIVIGPGLTYTAATKTLSVSATGIVNSVTGTSNRITISGTSADPIIDIASTYAGQATIVTVGTITAGTWQGAIVDGEFGGTGLDVSTGTIGDSIRISAGGEWEFYTPSGGGGGTVTTVSVATANGFAGTVANATTTPAITLTTSVTGLIKGNGTAISAATAGTDYVVPGAITGSGLTMATARLLGRTTATTGAIEEISVAGRLTLSAGVLTGLVPTVNSAFTSQTTVTITHNLGYYPLVQAINGSGDLISPASVVHGSTNAFTVTFSTSTTGNIIYA